MGDVKKSPENRKLDLKRETGILAVAALDEMKSEACDCEHNALQRRSTKLKERKLERAVLDERLTALNEAKEKQDAESNTRLQSLLQQHGSNEDDLK